MTHLSDYALLPEGAEKSPLEFIESRKALKLAE